MQSTVLFAFCVSSYRKNTFVLQVISIIIFNCFCDLIGHSYVYLAHQAKKNVAVGPKLLN